MRNKYSILSCLLVITVFFVYRITDITPEKPLKITLWDANGYYLYLPSILIYHDFKELKWVDSIDAKYHVTGGDGVQAQKAENGNYVFKYLGGVAVMELPFFLLAHQLAPHFGYPQDGFSAPYQYALGFAILLYSFLALLVLRKILLNFFDDITAALTILLIGLATNYIVYAAIDSGQTHAYIFLIYCLTIAATIRWHNNPSILQTLLVGYLCGFATMSRPTEAIIIFIPIFWNTHTKEAAQQKWNIIKQKPYLVAIAVVGGLLGVLPQTIYWKATTGTFVYDVGSKWKFLNPYFRVLFGFEKGWFIYTPVTIFFLVGFWFMRGKAFRKSVLWYCLLNIWIIIAWDEWRYGGSYSTRALVQSYPMFALPFASFIDFIKTSRWKWVFAGLACYLMGVNLFQVVQYNKTILHYDDMNRKYYGRIYLNSHPSPVDFSFMDNDEALDDTSGYQGKTLLHTDSLTTVHFKPNEKYTLADGTLDGAKWIKVEMKLNSNQRWKCYLQTEIIDGDKIIKKDSIRLYLPTYKDNTFNPYELWTSIPTPDKNAHYKISLISNNEFNGTISQMSVRGYRK